MAIESKAMVSGWWRASASLTPDSPPIVITKGFTHIGKSLQPTSVDATWHFSPAEGWVLAEAYVVGRLLRKDGMVGATEALVRFEEGAQRPSFKHPLSDAPDYVQEWVRKQAALLPELKVKA